ncbi:MULTISPECIES: sulfatase-like hydrolase/transferase [unclassified Lentimonas]|uniref:sulfatase-like hydrolase/transferase n=1 Tax=unclassified Lentimonas TaxID=2630993 RepID=UPI001321B8F7|nr:MULTISPECIES: sulfatase-like hydrolase/transferase [unclassified Lentimonas]CAA6679765.1 Unannotated [Lentimonas sp. CC4]CAA6685724.1 Unannotated [Lentimonas sp. CC6]CAA7077167.1 Unannotated [Lentimonas sp. CC4]CAA7168749.1 Unannotated [Lentimonas sp. CC21]CAA7180883.1 Unannotated [Lentimonas sp. CC8]
MNRPFTLFSLLFASVAAASAINTPTAGVALPAGPATIALEWTDTATDETGFQIERSVNGTFPGVLVADETDLPTDSRFFYDRGLAVETEYYYRVRAVDDTLSSNWLSLGSATTTAKMNIIFFLADDMGYKDIVALRNPAIDGPTIYETPALDTFIEQNALSVNNAYCSGPRCVVARRSIQVGKYDWRPEAVPSNDYYVDHAGDPTGGGIWAGGTTVQGSKAGQGVSIPYDNVTYGEAVKAAGYRTCFIGKYHLGESDTADKPTGYVFGDQPGRGPIAQGYDVSIAAGHAGAPPSSYFALLNQNAGANGAYTFELPDMDSATYGTAAPVAGEYITDRMTAKAIGFIDDAINNQAGEPFHLTLAHYAVHTPAECKDNANSTDGKGHEYFQAKKESMAAEFAAHPAGSSALITDYSTKTRVWQDNPVYAGMMKSYDDSFNELVTYLKATDDPRVPGSKLFDTTIIVVSADHGGKSTTPIDDGKSVEAADGSDTVNPPAVYVPADNAYKSGNGNTYSSYPTSNYPYRQGKTWVYEGGLKVPFLIYYPGLTAGGTQTDAFVHHADLFASFVDMAGGTQQPAESTDSISFMLTAAKPEASARDEMHHFFTNANTGTGNPALAAYRKGDYKLLYFMVQRKVELYNIVSDVYERNDLSASRPDLAAEMLHEIYQQALSTGMKMPAPGSNTWTSEQSILIDNGVIGSLPAVPDADPTWVGAGAEQISPRTIELNWAVNASNATHSVIYRTSEPDGETSYREYAYVPAGVTTFRDYDLVPGGKYKYRVESENLGGWAAARTSNDTVTLGAGSNLQIVANDDTITTVPGELRIINPLLNDGGEGALTITAITLPTVGSASIENGKIHYQAPAEFAGSVTMTYTIEDGVGQADTGEIELTLPQSESLNTLERWDFSEVANTEFGNTTSLTGLAFASISPADSVQTDGAGHLVFSKVSTTGNSSKNTTASIAGAPYASGQYQLEMMFSSIDLDDAATTTATKVGFAFRDNSDGSDFGLIRFAKASTSEINLELQMYDTDKAGGAGFVVQALKTFNSVNLSDMAVRATLDMDATPMTIAVELSEAGGSFQDLGTYEVENADATSFDRLKIQSNIGGLAGSDSLQLDYLNLSELLDASSIYDAYASAYDWGGVKETGPNDSPASDGLTNFYKFAFGLDPLTPSTGHVTSLVENGAGLDIRFTPVRDTTEVIYTVERATDLNDWDSETPVVVDSPAGQEVSVPLPGVDRGFGRVRPSI